jgi:hypothetical protein
MAVAMPEYSAAPTATISSDEDDWFGEGNAFESGEELASALLAMAEEPEEAEVIAESQLEHTAGGQRETFVLLDADALLKPAASSEQPVSAAPPSTGSRSWSVRAPGAIPLPPRAPGRSGWTIRNSVQVLQRTEEIINGLRHEAIVTALGAAFRAFHPDRPPTDARSHPV